MKTFYVVNQISKLESYGFKKHGILSFVYGDTKSTSMYCGIQGGFILHSHLGCANNKVVIEKMLKDGILEIKKMDEFTELDPVRNEDLYHTLIKMTKPYGRDYVNAVMKLRSKDGFYWERNSVDNINFRKYMGNQVTVEDAMEMLVVLDRSNSLLYNLLRSKGE